MNGRILLTGASGFLGGAVLDRLRAGPDSPLRLLVHRTEPRRTKAAPDELVRADLTDPGSLAGICDGVRTVIHAASAVGDDEALGLAVNALGTEALAAEARAAGVRRFLYISSAAVYGWAVHCGATEEEAVVRPATAISLSRARAERAVLDIGGAVLRPLFVYGRGDRTFLPALIRSLERYRCLVDGGRARLSVISVDDLASVVAELALSEREPAPRGAYHVNDNRPIRLREIVDALVEEVGVRKPLFSLPYALACRLMRPGASRVFGRAGLRSADHRIFLVARDHYYDASRVWATVESRPGPPFGESLASSADWYARFLEPAAARE